MDWVRRNFPTLNNKDFHIKRYKTREDPFTTHLDVNFIEGFKRQKWLKAAIKAPIQSYLCLSIEKNKKTNVDK